MTNFLLIVCAWHESRQLPLESFSFSHGICPFCLAKLESDMQRKQPQWVRLMRDGEWVQIADGSFCGSLVREIPDGKLVVRFVGADSPRPYRLTKNDVEIATGDLDEVLEAGNAYIV